MVLRTFALMHGLLLMLNRYCLVEALLMQEGLAHSPCKVKKVR